MKSTLLLAGLLAVSGSLAHAQGLTIAGNGRMGLQYDSNGFAGGSDWRAEHRLQLNFTATAEGDNGLRFGAFSRAQMDVGRTGLFSGSRVWVEASGLRLTFGNQNGAIATSGTARGVGGRIGYEGGQQHGETGGLRGVITRFGGTAGAGANTSGESTAHLRYAGDGWQAAISTERGRGVELGVRAAFGAVTVAAGHQTARGGTVRASTASAHYNGGTWGVTGLVARVGSQTNGSVAANVTLGGGELYGYLGRIGGNDTYGVSYGLGLGGGARIVAGGERVAGRTTASLGVTFRF